jgi:hypothetical protein
VALPDVMQLLTSAEEFAWIKLRRDEKALLKTLNGSVRFPLLDERGKPMKGATFTRSHAAYLCVLFLRGHHPWPWRCAAQCSLQARRSCSCCCRTR